MPGITKAMTPRGFVSRPDDVPAFWAIGNLWRVMASGIHTDNSFCLLDQLVTDLGGGPCTHAHPTDEGLYVVSGHCSFQAGGQKISAGPGCFVGVPRFAEHSFVVDAPGTQLLNFYLPAGFELFVMGFSHPAERNELPPPGLPMPPRRLVEQLSRDYGQIPVLGLPAADPPGADNMATKPLPEAVVQPFATHADSAPAYWYEGGLWTVLADSASTDGSYSVFEQLLPQGAGAAPHVHFDADEMFYVLDGAVEYLVGDRLERAAKGDFMFVPRGTVTAHRVTSSTARMLALYTPAGVERLVRSLGVQAEQRISPPMGWRTPSVPDGVRERLFADLGYRTVAVASPFQ